MVLWLAVRPRGDFGPMAATVAQMWYKMGHDAVMLANDLRNDKEIPASFFQSLQGEDRRTSHFLQENSLYLISPPPVRPRL